MSPIPSVLRLSLAALPDQRPRAKARIQAGAFAKSDRVKALRLSLQVGSQPFDEGADARRRACRARGGGESDPDRLWHAALESGVRARG